MDIESIRKTTHPEAAPDPERLLAVLDEAVASLEGAGITYLTHGRRRDVGPRPSAA